MVWGRQWILLTCLMSLLTWVSADPLLTDLGIQQAYNVNKAWKEEIKFHIPLPESIYSSPFTRAVRTAAITFEDLLPSAVGPLTGTKKGLIKEVIILLITWVDVYVTNVCRNLEK